MFLSNIWPITLGIIQGITEALPLSSSSHLALLQHLCPIPTGRSYAVMLHMGTLLGIALYLNKEIRFIFNEMISILLRKKPFSLQSTYILLIASSIPLMFVPFMPSLPWDGSWASMLAFMGISHLGFGAMLWLCDTQSFQQRNIEVMPVRHAWSMGCAQILAALLPGVSRLGVCLTLGRYLGYERASLLRFSLLMSIPAILGALLHELVSLGKGPLLELSRQPTLMIAAATAAVASFITLKITVPWVVRYGWKMVCVYRILFGLILWFVAFLYWE